MRALWRQSRGYQKYLSPNPLLLAEIGTLNQPVRISFPNEPDTHFVLHLRTRRFASRDLDVVSRTFKTKASNDNDLAIVTGFTHRDLAWRVEIRRCRDTTKSALYSVTVRVGGDVFADGVIDNTEPVNREAMGTCTVVLPAAL